ncbi:hypothetical protein LCGC14_0541730 [marine sediment metagenome]|uniref:Uncharacterized protein n=1 Tax=marine sediment metagenome TaxID=412755 RepID=A0A0F9UDZ1_9ZZZZ
MKQLIARYPSGGVQYAYDTKINRERAATAYACLGFNSLIGFDWLDTSDCPFGLSVRVISGIKFRRINC